MATTTVPSKVIAEDHRLESLAADSQEQLARLRWHWTLDETNPARVSIREYARTVGRSEGTINPMVNGYAAHLAARDRDIAITRSLTDEIEMAKMGEQKRHAATAIAKAMGTNVANVASNHRSVIRDTIATATENAERRRTTVDEEISRAALSYVRTRESEARTAAERKSRATLRFIEMEGDFATAKRRLMNALRVAADVGFDDEEMKLLRQTIAQIAALLTLIDLRVGGTANVDWDAELAKLAS